MPGLERVHALDHVVVLVLLFFELLYPVNGEICMGFDLFGRFLPAGDDSNDHPGQRERACYQRNDDLRVQPDRLFITLSPECGLLLRPS